MIVLMKLRKVVGTRMDKTIAAGRPTSQLGTNWAGPAEYTHGSPGPAQGSWGCKLAAKDECVAAPMN